MGVGQEEKYGQLAGTLKIRVNYKLADTLKIRVSYKNGSWWEYRDQMNI